MNQLPELAQLEGFLNQLHSDFHQESFLSSDPLEFVHRYSDPWDQEAVALLAAVLAYGNVKQIRNSVQNALNRIELLSDSPSAFVMSLSGSKFRRDASKAFESYVHRFNVGQDLVLLFWLLGESWNRHGSLGSHFLFSLGSSDSDIGNALSTLMGEWKTWLGRSGGLDVTQTFSYLLTSPSDGSCCKRWCMFLRWMGRKDHLDLGLWTRGSQGSPLLDTFPKDKFLHSKQLVMPLDTHTGRISQYLGLTQRKSLNWKAALEVTESLKKVDPKDPTRYDFAIARLGILDLCQKKYREEICKKCQLLPVCHYAQKLSSGRLRSTQFLA